MTETEPQNNAAQELAPDQIKALEALTKSNENLFITGSAGSGKSFVIKKWRERLEHEELPVLASTGAAAVLVGGRTFHSFFGLGIMEGGMEATVERASRDRRLFSRLKSVKCILIDEISMISGQAFVAADRLAQRARGKSEALGGIRVIAVGDFSQLPPIQQGSQHKDWSFRTESWSSCDFKTLELKINHRVEDSEFLSVLESIRLGEISARVQNFLNDSVKRTSDLVRALKQAGSSSRETEGIQSAPRLLARRDAVERFNQERLAALPGDPARYESIFMMGNSKSVNAKSVEQLKRSLPFAEGLELKVGARVLFVQNDPQRRWVNGTRGTVRELKKESIIIEKENGRAVKVEPVLFSLLDADGEVLASALAYPLVLAYAVTIHKSQGMTLSSLCTDLSRLWEPGQAYVALSRLRSKSGLYLTSWDRRSILVDPAVLSFYKQSHDKQ